MAAIQNGDDQAHISELKEEGNQYFKAGDFVRALDCYTQAIKLGPANRDEKATLFKNRAAVYLKQEKYAEAERDATSGLHLFSKSCQEIANSFQLWK